MYVCMYGIKYICMRIFIYLYLQGKTSFTASLHITTTSILFRLQARPAGHRHATLIINAITPRISSACTFKLATSYISTTFLYVLINIAYCAVNVSED